jgi:hypothetical protein
MRANRPHLHSADKEIAMTFDIFYGRNKDEKLQWLGAADDFENACHRMHAFASMKPGPYFVLRLVDKEVLATMDTSSKEKVGGQN